MKSHARKRRVRGVTGMVTETEIYISELSVNFHKLLPEMDIA